MGPRIAAQTRRDRLFSRDSCASIGLPHGPVFLKKRPRLSNPELIMDDSRLIVNYQRSSTAEKDYRHRQLATDGWLPLLHATPAMARRADSISGQWWAQPTLRSGVG